MLKFVPETSQYWAMAGEAIFLSKETIESFALLELVSYKQS